MGTAGVAMVAFLALMVPIVVGQSTSFLQTFREGRFNAAFDRAEQLVPEQYRADVARAKTWFTTNASTAPVGAPETTAGTSSAAVDANHQLKSGVKNSGAPQADGAATGSHQADDKNLTKSQAKLQFSQDAVREIAATEADAIQRAVAAEMDRRGLVSQKDANSSGGVQWSSILGSSAEQVFQTAIEVLSIGFLTALVPFYFWFFSINFPSALEFLRGLLPVSHRENVLKLAGEMDRAVSGFVRGRIVISVIMGVLIAVGWKFFGVPYAITLGVVVGVFSLVPYLSVVGLPIAVGLLAVDQLSHPEAQRMTWLWLLLGPTVVYGVVQLLEGYVLIPLIAGKATDLDPVSIFVAVLAGAAIAGVYGMLLSIPVAACFKIYLREVVLPRLREWSSGGAHDSLPLEQR